MLKKRIRTSNFTETEEDILLQCVLRHAKVVENKKTDACTLNEKQRVWEKIVMEFNSLCPNVARQSKALKDKYSNIKTMLRKQFAAEKASRIATGGGKEMPKWQPRTEAMAELAKVISISIHGTSPTLDDDEDDKTHDTTSASFKALDVECNEDQNQFEPTSVITQTVEVQQNYTGNSVLILEDIEVKDLVLSTKVPEPMKNESWADYNPSMLRKANKHKLKRPLSGASSSNGEKEDSVQNLKKKLIERELEMREIEHQTRLSQQQVEHEARKALLEAQKMDFETKVKFRQMKIAKFTKENNDETDSE